MPWHTWEWVMSHIWMSHGTVAHFAHNRVVFRCPHRCKSWHTCASPVTHLNESWHSGVFCKTTLSCSALVSARSVWFVRSDLPLSLSRLCHTIIQIIMCHAYLPPDPCGPWGQLSLSRFRGEYVIYDNIYNNASYTSSARSVWFVRPALPLSLSRFRDECHIQ